MIHKTTDLGKFKKLQRRLGFTKRRDVIGLLESLWHMAIREAPQGNIGRLDDETIAIGLEWDGDPEKLIEYLVETRWLDRDETHRLLIHDWHEHAPKFLLGNLSSRGKEVFSRNGCSKLTAKAGCFSDSLAACSEHRAPIP